MSRSALASRLARLARKARPAGRWLRAALAHLRRQSALWTTAVALIGAAVLLVYVLGGFGARVAAAPGVKHGIQATSDLTPQYVHFGDDVVATVSVRFGRGLDPRQIAVVPVFDPYHAVKVERTVSDLGDRTLLRLRYTLRCLSPACLPVKVSTVDKFSPTLSSTAGVPRVVQVRAVIPTAKVFALQPVAIVYQGGGGLKLGAVVLPPIHVAPRLSADDLTRAPDWRLAPAAPLHARGWLAWLALGALVGLALLPAVWALRRRRRQRQVAALVVDPAPAPDERALALAALRELAVAPRRAERRVALLEQLATLLEPDQPAVAGRLRRLAWGPELVRAGDLAALLAELEAVLERSAPAPATSPGRPGGESA